MVIINSNIGWTSKSFAVHPWARRQACLCKINMNCGTDDCEIELIDIDDGSEEDDDRSQLLLSAERTTAHSTSTSFTTITTATVTTPEGTVVGRGWKTTPLNTEHDSDASQDDTTDTLPRVSWGQPRTSQRSGVVEKYDNIYSDDDHVPPFDDLTSPTGAIEHTLGLGSSPIAEGTNRNASGSTTTTGAISSNSHRVAARHEHVDDDGGVQILSSPLVATPPRQQQTPSRYPLFPIEYGNFRTCCLQPVL